MSFFDDWYGIFTTLGDTFDDNDEEEVDWDSPCKCCTGSTFPCDCDICDGTDRCLCASCDCNPE